jgi:hypothetical protein
LFAIVPLTVNFFSDEEPLQEKNNAAAKDAAISIRIINIV